jgi:hypothetical protein
MKEMSKIGFDITEAFRVEEEERERRDLNNPCVCCEDRMQCIKNMDMFFCEIWAGFIEFINKRVRLRRLDPEVEPEMCDEHY